MDAIEAEANDGEVRVRWPENVSSGNEEEEDGGEAE